MVLKKFISILAVAAFCVLNFSTNAVSAFSSMSKTDYEKTVVTLKKQLEENPDDPQICAEIGDCFVKLYELDGIRYSNSSYEKALTVAREFYEKALKINPNCAEAYRGLGEIARVQAEEMSIYATMSDAQVFGMAMLGGGTINRGELKKAVEQANNDALVAYNKAIELDPANTELYYSRANFFETREMYNFAIEDYGKILALNDKDFYACVRRGELFNQTSDFTSAAKDFLNALEILNSPEIQSSEIIHLKRKKTNFREISYYKWYPKDCLVDAYIGKGEAYFGLKDYDTALEDFNRAEELEEYDYRVFYNRARVYEETGNFEAALADYEKTLKRAPKNKSAKDGKKRMKKAVKLAAKQNRKKK